MKQATFFESGSTALTDASGRTPVDYFELLCGAWCVETCAPRMRAQWSKDNPTKGQCSVTAFLMQDIFGGKVLGIPLGDGNYHCFNAVGDSVFDLTSAQFVDTALDYTACVEQTRQQHFLKAEKKARYELLKDRLMAQIKSVQERE